MGLFNRRKQITSEQQNEALRALAIWENAHNLTEWRQAAQTLAALGGWEWWIAVARAAESISNYKLVGQIACFTTQSKALLRGEPGFVPPARATCEAVDEIAVRCLRNAPPDLVIQDGSAGRIDVEKLVTWATSRMENGLN
jgi:hypothetical protein